MSFTKPRVRVGLGVLARGLPGQEARPRGADILCGLAVI